MILATKKLSSLYPGLLICCDVCICPYATHGHCGRSFLFFSIWFSLVLINIFLKSVVRRNQITRSPSNDRALQLIPYSYSNRNDYEVEKCLLSIYVRFFGI